MFHEESVDCQRPAVANLSRRDILLTSFIVSITGCLQFVVTDCLKNMIFFFTNYYVYFCSLM